MEPATTPRVLWVELTSKCPFDCVFCSRKVRRGSGEHMAWAIFESLVAQVVDPRKFLLNYSGESTVYPELIRAIRLARLTGAAVELVSALANASEDLVDELADSGLTRLTVSVHAAAAGPFDDIYRYGSWERLRRNLVRIVERSRAMTVDVAFVAMERNLGELGGVARLADDLGLSSISLFPVIRRDEIPVTFGQELGDSGTHRDGFRDAVQRAVRTAADEHPRVAFTVCNPAFVGSAPPLGEVPSPCPGELPAGARIHSCEQNPWETAHVLSNGDVVACEVHDQTPLGNLGQQSLEEIWHSEAYARFRRSYERGDSAACRACCWKTAYRPGPLSSEILAARGRNAQLWHGWHDPVGEAHVWASQRGAAVVEPRASDTTLHVNGILPAGPAASNRLEVTCSGTAIGEVVNASATPMAFGVDLRVPAGALRPWTVEFRTENKYCPAERGDGPDHRDLGFALHVLAAHSEIDPELVRRRRKKLSRLLAFIGAVDRVGRALRPLTLPRDRVSRLDPGLSVIIPERDNAADLDRCLAALARAAELWTEPLETRIVVNGSSPEQYGELAKAYPKIQWSFHPQPLGFAGAIAAGVRQARYGWVYLLNSDAYLEPDALAAAAALRDATVFSIASQIVFEDATRYRDETNWTAGFLEDGIIAAHDLIPNFDHPVEHFYSGGGASMFQRRILEKLLDPPAYHPFYWEDIEWGWRARKLGYRAVFCPASVARHSQRATISRLYSRTEVESTIERHRYLFQLRNLTEAGSLEAVAEAIARADAAVAEPFFRVSTLAGIARSRLWNHLAPVADETVLSAFEHVQISLDALGHPA
jgi:GT2 family glycosyltransferase/MoaA/NifB/PqqE/SkfB family radical SAM enzyme